ncbi:MAG: PqqD family peptide modification chaperone [Candidatus Omnitrophica bacterium]|nr:PqqD family peptide modification chaperone [Candidatus Omnitrophota bacterium]
MERKCPLRNPDVVVRKEKDEALLFDPSDGNMMCMNSTGIFVWDECDGKSSAEEISRKIEEEFEVSSEVAEKDCRSFLEELEKSGFIGYAF